MAELSYQVQHQETIPSAIYISMFFSSLNSMKISSCYSMDLVGNACHSSIGVNKLYTANWVLENGHKASWQEEYVPKELSTKLCIIRIYA